MERGLITRSIIAFSHNVSKNKIYSMQSSIRIQPTCRATGEAAGIAAAYAVKNNIGLRDVDGKIIREIMRNYGADL
ncbi:FAD-dependent oxidoreductase [Caldanaerobacter subterraneus]|uniref:FAD-dependent oxidoreductase n=1 Tax=Caldanaerobacter subterraneus TaxID=911092 RepID=UPI00241D76A6|nr:FAD-dependent oxidoreductase [Caldanaerobacter subterraneus]